jgi:hypothetical protein
MPHCLNMIAYCTSYAKGWRILIDCVLQLKFEKLAI